MKVSISLSRRLENHLYVVTAALKHKTHSKEIKSDPGFESLEDAFRAALIKSLEQLKRECTVDIYFASEGNQTEVIQLKEIVNNLKANEQLHTLKLYHS
jgi:hypothetical protein